MTSATAVAKLKSGVPVVCKESAAEGLASTLLNVCRAAVTTCHLCLRWLWRQL